MFCYKLARVNRQAADQFYSEAAAAYSRAPMDQFLYLSAYPFGSTRDAGEMPNNTTYAVPEDYTPNVTLERAFMKLLLSRAERALGMPVDEVASYRYPDHAQMWFALTRLESPVQTSLPDLAEATTRTKDKLFTMLNPAMQQNVDGEIVTQNAPRKSFDGQVEWAEKAKNPAHRDQLLTSAVTASSKDQPVDKVLSVIDKISDPAVREPLVNWFYYFRAQALISSKDFTEARKAAARVAELDQRAYLYTRIAEETLKTDENQTVARELLDEVAQAISKAPKTIVSARALLALAYLYAKVEMNRGIEELGNAVKTINALEAPDFSRQFVLMKIEGKTFASYFSFSTPGFNPENAFREMGKLDFDGSLQQATMFSDKTLRSLTTLAVIEPCFVTKKRKAKSSQ
jgi:tetratricopeptide (TPR) repeat protein